MAVNGRLVLTALVLDGAAFGPGKLLDAVRNGRALLVMVERAWHLGGDLWHWVGELGRLAKHALLAFGNADLVGAARPAVE